ncbi:hypothetical protein soil367_18115 [Hydrocarboniclastica marina]|uniref:Uncharacterized protein n=2 Tax=Hydrocarboniclastica marina TaxID=2259620 RepID=A0A4P7XKE3_9ALTE|nr:hypothetical protein soil367_18115 [Hydrocarboniclastica marina]
MASDLEDPKMNQTEHDIPEGEVTRKVALRGCALMLAGLISMTVVAVGERTGDLDQLRSRVSEAGASSALLLSMDAKQGL